MIIMIIDQKQVKATNKEEIVCIPNKFNKIPKLMMMWMVIISKIYNNNRDQKRLKVINQEKVLYIMWIIKIINLLM